VWCGLYLYLFENSLSFEDPPYSSLLPRAMLHLALKSFTFSTWYPDIKTAFFNTQLLRKYNEFSRNMMESPWLFNSTAV
jgi:hypothetical protein